MRTLMKITVPVEAGNRGIKDGNLENTIQGMMKRLTPEAAYFYPENGHRTMLFVFDLKSPADLPTITEPLFMDLNASVEMVPVMNVEDLKKGLSAMIEQHGAAKH
jgi:hypothetical protein